jgi:hypothetical protein
MNNQVIDTSSGETLVSVIFKINMQEIKILYNFEIYKILEFGPLSDPFLSSLS